MKVGVWGFTRAAAAAIPDPAVRPLVLRPLLAAAAFAGLLAGQAAGAALAPPKVPRHGVDFQVISGYTIEGAVHPLTPPPPAPGQPPLLRYYPERAQAEHVEGRAVLACTDVDAERHPTGCRVVDETPENYGFGETALTLARVVRVRDPSSPGALVLTFNSRMADHPKPLDLIQKPEVLKAAYVEDYQGLVRGTYPRFVGEAWAVVSCRVNAIGRAQDCRTLAASRPDEGLHALANSLGNRFFLAPKDKDGAPVAGRTLMLLVRMQA